MKLRCIKNVEYESSLTIGKTYECHDDTLTTYSFIGDDGRSRRAYRTRFEEVKDEVQKKVIGYKAIKRFPGLSDVLWDLWTNPKYEKPFAFQIGSPHEKEYTPDKYPEYFEPVYEPDKPPQELVTLSSGLVVVVKKGSIRADGQEWPFEYVKKIQDINYNIGGHYGHKFKLLKFKIGCQEFTPDDVDLITRAYIRLN